MKPTKTREIDDLLTGRLPDARGRFGPYGGRFVPETLMPAILRLEAEARHALADPGFQGTLADELEHWVGRPTALTRATRLGAMGRRPVVEAGGPHAHWCPQDQ
jgi:tryptophan synthase beta chain